MIVPQANDIDKILDLPLAVADGANTKHQITKRYDFDGRQADYYIEAVGALGLIKSESGMYSLTDEGKKYRRMDPAQQKLMIVRKMIALPIIAIVLGELVANDRRTISKDEIENVIKENTAIRGTTGPRRAECLFKWLGWIGDETNVFSTEDEVIKLRVAEKSIP
jgi:hypothetical protein